ncbi:MAG: outer membrane lipoprotein carrier protein LolA [bacterium]|nr:outer membrane lipoprotein carrier protein LolA [bacterium]
MFRNYVVLSFCCLSLLTVPPFVGSQALAAAEKQIATQKQPVSERERASLLVQVEKNYAKMQSLECSFQQLSKSGGRVREGNGKAFFFRPGGASDSKDFAAKGGVIRWEYLGPDEQTIINDGQEIQIYTPADKQLLISSAEALDADLTYALFTGQSSLSETFTVSEGDADFQLSPPPSGLRALYLVPKEPQSQLKQAQIWINKDLQIERLLMEDYFDALTELSFSDMRFDRIKPGDRAKIQQLRTLKTTPDTEIIRQ